MKISFSDTQEEDKGQRLSFLSAEQWKTLSINRHINKTTQAAGRHKGILTDIKVLQTSINQVLMNRVNLVNKKLNKTGS